jgi:23S rRNA G2069 N7-methylase RlmK/C1962 C5-methylase RlmI
MKQCKNKLSHKVFESKSGVTSMFHLDDLDDINDKKNTLLAYLQDQSPETLAKVAQSVSPEVKQIISQNIQNIVGMLPHQSFSVQITTDRENLAGLLGSAMMTGYFLKQMETRKDLDSRLASTSTLDEEN